MLKLDLLILYIGFFICSISCHLEGDSKKSLKYPLVKNKLTESQHFLYYIRTGIPTSLKSMENLQGIPQDFSDIRYISIKISNAPDSIISGLRGIDNLGNEVFYFDSNNDENFINESPVLFTNIDSGKTHTLVIQFDELIEGKVYHREILVELCKEEIKVDYHIVNYWESEVVLGNDTLKSGILRIPPFYSIMIIDSDRDGIYDKHFDTKAERVALGGKFYRIQIDLPAEEINFIETVDQPVDVGYPAPIFSGQIYESDRLFNLSQELGKVTVLFFSVVGCPGTKFCMPTLLDISEEFANNNEVNFISIAQDSSEALKYYSRFDFPFSTIIDYEIWKDYGVISTPNLFIIDKNNIIQQRGMIFDTKVLSGKINKLL